jgi:hypothetical protein
MSNPPASETSPSVLGSGELPRVAPTLRLSRLGLILSLLAMVAIGLIVYSIFPDSVGGPPLPVEVSLDRRLVDSVGGRPVVADVVVVRNPTEHPIPHLSLDINGQYLLFRDTPLAVGEEFVVPQQVFTDKRSSQRFDPSQDEVEDVVATGQLPSGARGVSKFEFEDGRPKAATNEE